MIKYINKVSIQSLEVICMKESYEDDFSDNQDDEEEFEEPDYDDVD